MKIGIPRALIYWKKPLFWENFFENLGVEVILSPKTNKEIIEKGVKVTDPETCFASKVFLGHVLWLEGKVDFIFIPRLKRNELGLEFCPRFFGLPDVVKILIKTPILSPRIDLKKEGFEKILKKFGKKILGKSDKKIKLAIEKSIEKEKEEKEEIKKEYFKKIESKKKKIILISHPYNLYDDYVNLEIKKKLEDLGMETIFIDQIPISNGKNLDQKPKFHWEFGQEMISQIKEILKDYNPPKDGSSREAGSSRVPTTLPRLRRGPLISGAIEISSFQCGCDAVLKEFFEEEFKSKKIPFLYLLIDEQTGEAGIQTRLEAFIDTLH